MIRTIEPNDKRVLASTDDTVTISKKVYISLLDDSEKLCCLESGGVDNWVFYHDSLEQGGYFND